MHRNRDVQQFHVFLPFLFIYIFHHFINYKMPLPSTDVKFKKKKKKGKVGLGNQFYNYFNCPNRIPFLMSLPFGMLSYRATFFTIMCFSLKKRDSFLFLKKHFKNCLELLLILFIIF